MTNAVRRAQIVETLNGMGISGQDVYYVELVPLVEMVWADGKRQPGELEVLDGYIKKLVDRLNALTPAYTFSIHDAKTFALRYLRERPARELMSILRELALELASDQSRQTLLKACLDIAASAVVAYPYEPDERFDPAEKQLFFEILNAAS